MTDTRPHPPASSDPSLSRREVIIAGAAISSIVATGMGVEISIMPAEMSETMAKKELVDLVEDLSTLHGR
jgi:hypothetical protein